MTEPGTPAAAGTPHRVSRLRLAVIGALLVIALTTLFSSVVPARDGLRATDRMLRAQQEENAQLRQRVEDLCAESEALRTDPWLVQRVVRDELHVMDEGEVIVR